MAAIRVQTAYRAYRARYHWRRTRELMIKLQSRFRGKVAPSSSRGGL